ncbi:hypothetical protein GCM10023166_03320 [Paeniglutamicibacter cryotolerans]
MHGDLRAPNGMNLKAADTPASMERKGGTAISVTLSGDDKDEMTAYSENPSDGAQIGEQLAPAPWGDWFGMLSDKFGVDWMVDIAGPDTRDSRLRFLPDGASRESRPGAPGPRLSMPVPDGQQACARRWQAPGCPGPHGWICAPKHHRRVENRVMAK